MNSEQLWGLVETAAEQELQSRFTVVHGHSKADGSLVTEADTAMQARLEAELAARWPAIPLLGEEMEPAQQRRILEGSDRFWCLDPLDGTTNFATGLPYYAVSLALVERGEVVLGVVYDPQRRECFRAERGVGAWLNRAPLRLADAPPRLADCVAVVDFKRLEPALACRLVSAPPYRSQRSLGAVALEWCWLAAGRCQLYLHGSMKAWDHAAGGLVLEQAGGVACLAGRPGGDCRPGLATGTQTGVGAVSPGLFRDWMAWIG